jgi:hypothetical protein
MKKLFFLPIVFIVSHFTSSAQTIRLGFTAGAAFANYTSKVDGETDNADSKTGATAGVLADVSTSKHFSFQPALNFVQKGTKNKEPFNNVTERTTLGINCIEMPLNFLYKAGGNSGNFFIGAGPSLAFALSGKLKFKDNTNSASEDIKFGSVDDDVMKVLDLGANFTTGYCFRSGLMLSANYNKGLNNLFPHGSDDGKLKSSYFGIRLGYLLNKKAKK